MSNIESLAVLCNRRLQEYLGEPLGDFYAQGVNRLMLYPFIAMFFLIECLAYWGIFHGPDFLMRHMAFVTVYSLHKAAVFTACLLAADLLARIAAPSWGAYQRRTVGRQWLIWAFGFLAAILLLQSLVNGLIGYYAPGVASYMAAHPDARPGILQIILIILPYWVVGVFFALQIARSKNRILRLMGSMSVVAEDPAGNQRPNGGKQPKGILKLGKENGNQAISLADITHITMEDHYCRVSYAAEDRLKNVLIRLPLKEMISQLPVEHFLQTHRSHVVNLAHVSHLAKLGRERKLVLNRFPVELPVSRHRFKELEPRLKRALDGSPAAQ
jgi:hypothetical protein